MEARGRKRIGSTAVLVPAAAAIAFLVWLVGPALSLGPYVPDPVDFELHGAPQVKASTRVSVVQSQVLQTTKRFDLVGFRWRGAQHARLFVRVRRTGANWSSWVRLAVASDDAPDPPADEGKRSWTVSDPLWAGESDGIQYRIATAGAVRDIHIHFVNSKGTATPFDRLRSGFRRAAHAAVTVAASVFGERASAQDNLQPEIVTRAQWGADKCPPRAPPAYGEVKLAFIHHTVSANDYAPEDSAAMVLAICRYHRNSNGWNDIGYNFLVDKFGKIFEGRAGGIDKAVIGAQAQGYNSQSTGIANLGTFSTTTQTPEGLAALARLLSWKLALHGVPPQGKVSVVSAGGATNRYPAGTEVSLDRISGHRDGDATSCPGDGLYAQLPALRQMVTPDPRPPTSLSLTSVRGRIPYGRKARVAGRLAGSDGSPLGGQPVGVQALGIGAGEGTLANIQTDSAGTFAVNVRLVFNRTLQATFVGSPALRPALSAPLVIGVRPRVVASLGSATPAPVPPGKRVLVHGSVRPRKRMALLLVDRQGSDGVFRRVVNHPVAARFGRIRAYHRFRKPGRYRIRLGVDRDTRNFSARSAALFVNVG
jgi:hypothetical protein